MMIDKKTLASTLPICAEYGKVIQGGQGDTIGIFTREEQLESMIETLISPESRNLILLGRAGVGKTALVYDLANHIKDGKCPLLKGKIIISIDMNRLKGAQTSSSPLEKIIKNLWQEAKNNGNVIFFIDEAHKISGGQRGQDSIGDMLKPLVTSGDVPVILATTNNEYVMYFEKDDALKRRFPPVHIPEPDKAILLEILKIRGEKLYFPKCGVTFPKELYEKVVKFSMIYCPERAEPERSLRVLERACAIALLRATGSTVEVADVEKAAAKIANVNLPDGKPRLCEEIKSDLECDVKGQGIAVELLPKFVVKAAHKLCSIDKPNGVFLFVGPSGCGKTQMSHAVGKQLGIKSDDVVKISFPVGGLYVSSKPTILGHEGHPDSSHGLLSEPIRIKPSRIVLIDNVELADKDFFSTIAQIANEGEIRDSQGRMVNFRSSVIIMSANIAPKKGGLGFVAVSNLSDEAEREKYVNELRSQVKAFFPPDFIESIDEIIPFTALNKGHLMEIFEHHELPKLQERLKSIKDFEINFSDVAKDLIVDLSFDKNGGGRKLYKEIDRLMNSCIVPALTDYKGEKELLMTVENNNIVAKWQ